MSRCAGPTAANPPAADQPHDRVAYYRWLTHRSTGDHVQFDTTKVLPFYAWLAASEAFLENHCSGFGTNSTPNHLPIVAGQSPTLRNPPRTAPPPVWDMPSLPGHAGDNGLTWKAYTGNSGYPVQFYAQLNRSPNGHPTSSLSPIQRRRRRRHPARVVHDLARRTQRRTPDRQRHPRT